MKKFLLYVGGLLFVSASLFLYQKIYPSETKVHTPSSMKTQTQPIIPLVGSNLDFKGLNPDVVWYMNSSCTSCKGEYIFLQQLSKITPKLLVISREDSDYVKLFLTKKDIDPSLGIMNTDKLGRIDTNRVPLLLLLKDGYIEKVFLGTTLESDRKIILDYVSKCNSCTL